VRTLALILSLSVAVGAGAAEHRYDAFGKTILPFLNIFAEQRKSEARAFTLKIRIEKATDLPPELLGQTAEIAIETPDKLRLHGPLLGETFTLVRDGEKIWIHPGKKAKALLDAASGAGSLPPAKKDAELGDFKLPFSEKSLVFLPTLFSVKDLGFEPLDGIECRVLDITLMPELAEEVDVQGWVARIWITPEHKPARITVARKGWHIVARIDEVQFARELPEATWKPGEQEATDILKLKPAQYGRFLNGIWGGKAKK
jgi:hypothetical protein